jgi:hypothetical protein
MLATHKIERYTANACNRTILNTVRSHLLRFSPLPGLFSITPTLVSWDCLQKGRQGTSPETKCQMALILEQLNILVAFDTLELALCSIRVYCLLLCFGWNSY